MPYKKSKYSAEQNSMMKVKVMSVLDEEQEALSIQDIQNRDFELVGIPVQKMARILNELIDQGIVAKGKSKATGRMMYKSIAVMEEQGFNVD